MVVGLWSFGSGEGWVGCEMRVEGLMEMMVGAF